MNKYISHSIALAASTVFFATASAAITIEKPPVIDREAALNPAYKTAQEIINERGFQREAGANDDSAGTRNGYLNNPTRPSTGGAPNASIAAINCQHAAYKALCAEIDKKINDALEMSSGGGSNPTYEWVDVYSHSTGVNSYTIPAAIVAKASNYQFTIGGDTFTNNLGFTKTFPRSASGKVYCGNWSWSGSATGTFRSDGVISIPQKTVSYRKPFRQSQDCRTKTDYATIDVRITKIRAYVAQ